MFILKYRRTIGNLHLRFFSFLVEGPNHFRTRTNDQVAVNVIVHLTVVSVCCKVLQGDLTPFKLLILVSLVSVEDLSLSVLSLQFH